MITKASVLTAEIGANVAAMPVLGDIDLSSLPVGENSTLIQIGIALLLRIGFYAVEKAFEKRRLKKQTKTV